jgi:thiol reductant ABC exporter CydC subunit
VSADVPPSPDAARAPLGRTLYLARPVTGRLVLGTLLGAGAILADIGLMGTAAWLISRAAQHPNEASLAVAIVAVQFFGLSRGLLRYEERLVGHDAALHLLAELRVRAYVRLERLAPAGLPAFRRGDLLARIVHDVDSLQDLVIRAVPPFGMAVVVGVLTVATMAWMLPAAGLILAVALLVSATVVPWLTGRLARRRESSFAKVRGDLVSAMVDLTEGAAELVAFGAARAQVETVRRADAELTAIATSSAGTAGIGLALTTALAGLASCGCLTVGIAAVVAGHLGATELAVITLVPLAAFELVAGLPTATQALERVRQAAYRFFEVTDAPEPVPEPEPEATLRRPVAPFNLEVRSLWAGYPAAATPALRGVDLSLRPGRRVAVVGPSGAGKSTLAAVMLRFLPIQSGSVALNGTPVECLSGEGVRTVVGLVGQDAHIFAGTIAENLAVGRREASDQEMCDVLDRVGLTGWLAELPRGLRTQLGRSGARMSGGQRQRVAVARALLADFPILVLDEPGEHLDLPGADALTTDLLRATAGRSVVLITHRLAGLEAVDEILVMEAGTVVERGDHDHLLGRGGRYAALWLEEMMTERTASAAHLYPQADADHPMAATFCSSPDDGSRTP